jgi:hypothetical protein
MFLLHWNEAMLVSRIEMLRQAGIGPFARVAANPAPAAPPPGAVGATGR